MDSRRRGRDCLRSVGRGGADFSQPQHHHGHSIFGRRPDRYGRPAHRGSDVEESRPDRDRRKRGRRRRHARTRSGRKSESGRLHAAAASRRHVDGAGPLSQAAVQFGDRFRNHRLDSERADEPHNHEPHQERQGESLRYHHDDAREVTGRPADAQRGRAQRLRGCGLARPLCAQGHAGRCDCEAHRGVAGRTQGREDDRAPQEAGPTREADRRREGRRHPAPPRRRRHGSASPGVAPAPSPAPKPKASSPASVAASRPSSPPSTPEAPGAPCRSTSPTHPTTRRA